MLEAQEGIEGEDLSVATPEVVIQRGDADLTDGRHADERQTEMLVRQGGGLNVSHLQTQEELPRKPKPRALSPLLEAEEKDAAWNLG